jgi:hypothetical protein
MGTRLSKTPAFSGLVSCALVCLIPLKADLSPLFYVRKMDTDNIHIGNKIKEVLAEQERSVAFLARKINLDASACRRALKQANMHSQTLIKISLALDYDFFEYISQKLQNRQNQPDKK